jgi:hypothetical protein
MLISGMSDFKNWNVVPNDRNRREPVGQLHSVRPLRGSLSSTGNDRHGRKAAGPALPEHMAAWLSKPDIAGPLVRVREGSGAAVTAVDPAYRRMGWKPGIRQLASSRRALPRLLCGAAYLGSSAIAALCSAIASSRRPRSRRTVPMPLCG